MVEMWLCPWINSYVFSCVLLTLCLPTLIFSHFLDEKQDIFLLWPNSGSESEFNEPRRPGMHTLLVHSIAEKILSEPRRYFTTVNVRYYCSYRAIKWAYEGHHNTDTLVYCLNRQATTCVSGSVPFCVSGPGSMVSRRAVQTTAHPWPQLQAPVHAHLHRHPETAGKMHQLPLQSPFMVTISLQTAYTDFSPQLYFSRSSSRTTGRQEQ